MYIDVNPAVVLPRPTCYLEHLPALLAGKGALATVADPTCLDDRALRSRDQERAVGRIADAYVQSEISRCRVAREGSPQRNLVVGIGLSGPETSQGHASGIG